MGQLFQRFAWKILSGKLKDSVSLCLATVYAEYTPISNYAFHISFWAFSGKTRALHVEKTSCFQHLYLRVECSNAVSFLLSVSVFHSLFLILSIFCTLLLPLSLSLYLYPPYSPMKYVMQYAFLSLRELFFSFSISAPPSLTPLLIIILLCLFFNLCFSVSLALSFPFPLFLSLSLSSCPVVLVESSPRPGVVAVMLN